MTSTDQPDSEQLPSEDSVVKAYASLQDVGPPPALDARIREEAHAAVADRATPKRAILQVASVAAVAVLGIALTLNIRQSPEFSETAADAAALQRDMPSALDAAPQNASLPSQDDADEQIVQSALSDIDAATTAGQSPPQRSATEPAPQAAEAKRTAAEMDNGREDGRQRILLTRIPRTKSELARESFADSEEMPLDAQAELAEAPANRREVHAGQQVQQAIGLATNARSLEWHLATIKRYLEDDDREAARQALASLRAQYPDVDEAELRRRLPDGFLNFEPK